MTEESSTNEISILAEHCVANVREAVGFDLDYTVETLPVLDHFCRTNRSGALWASGAEHLARSVGSYFGEVLRKHFDNRCRWYQSDGGPHAWRLEFTDCFLCFNPLGAALELLLEGPAPGWNTDFVTTHEASEPLEALLNQLPGVSEEDFYTLSVRYEVLETVDDFLRRWQSKSKNPDRQYDSADYEARLALLEPDMTTSIE